MENSKFRDFEDMMDFEKQHQHKAPSEVSLEFGRSDSVSSGRPIEI